MDFKTMLSAAPLLTATVAGIISWANVSSATDANTDGLDRAEEKIEKNAEAIQELDKEVSVMKHQLDNVATDVGEVKGDVRSILTLIQSQQRGD